MAKKMKSSTVHSFLKNLLAQKDESFFKDQIDIILPFPPRPLFNVIKRIATKETTSSKRSYNVVWIIF